MTLTRLQDSLRKIRTSNSVLQYNHYTGHGLTVWGWPLRDNGERLPPSEFGLHRLSHQFLGPCCVCPLTTIRVRGQPPVFTEAAILVHASGHFAGEYVAVCAKKRCGYFVHIERLYDRLGVRVKVYPARDPDELRPSPVDIAQHRVWGGWNSNQGPHSPNVGRHLRRSYAVGDLNVTGTPVNPGLLTTWRPNRQTRLRTSLVRLLQLNSVIRPGLSEADFCALFVRCSACGLVMTRTSFKAHYCADTNVNEDSDVIELTDSGSDSD